MNYVDGPDLLTFDSAADPSRGVSLSLPPHQITVSKRISSSLQKPLARRPRMPLHDVFGRADSRDQTHPVASCSFSKHTTFSDLSSRSRTVVVDNGTGVRSTQRWTARACMQIEKCMH
jgi:hypothetical protein